jgi:folate-binding protein YgfZ
LGLSDIAEDPERTAFSARERTIAGASALVIDSPLGKLPCFYVLSTPDAATAIWPYLLDAGATPIGTDALEAVRVRQGVPAFGSEMGEPFNPLEAGLIGSVDFAKGCYIGQEVIARLDSYKKVQKYLVALIFEDGAEVSASDLLLQDGQPVGQVTSVSRLPGAGLSGLGYVKTASALSGGKLELEAPGNGTVEIQELAQLFGPGQVF